MPTLMVMKASGKLQELPLYGSAQPLKRKLVVYMVKTLADGVRLVFDQNYELIGAVRSTPTEWEAALIRSLDMCSAVHRGCSSI